MQDTFAELQAAFTRLNLVLRTIDPKISLASIESEQSGEHHRAARRVGGLDLTSHTQCSRAADGRIAIRIKSWAHTRFLSENPQRHEQRGLFRPDIGC